ncbi:hypothetical protein MRX96_005295 [Rhipicephalus microplus]
MSKRRDDELFRPTRKACTSNRKHCERHRSLGRAVIGRRSNRRQLIRLIALKHVLWRTLRRSRRRRACFADEREEGTSFDFQCAQWSGKARRTTPGGEGGGSKVTVLQVAAPGSGLVPGASSWRTRARQTSSADSTRDEDGHDENARDKHTAERTTFS